MERSKEYGELKEELYNIKLEMEFASIGRDRAKIESCRAKEEEIKKSLAQEMIKAIKNEEEQGRGRR